MSPASCAHAPLRVRKVLYYCGFIPSMVITTLLMVSLGMLLPYRWRMEFTTLWNAFVSGFWLRLCCGVKIVLEGEGNIPRTGPYMVVSNHQSEWETYYLARLFRPVCMVIKKELLSVPVFGWAMRAAQHIPVDRSQRHSSIDQIINSGLDRLRRGNNLLIFPEATRMPTGEIKRYSRTAAKLAVEAGVPLVPVVHTAGRCWSRSGEMRPGHIHVRVGQAIPTAGRNVDEVALQAEDWSRETFELIKDIE